MPGIESDSTQTGHFSETNVMAMKNKKNYFKSKVQSDPGWSNPMSLEMCKIVLMERRAMSFCRITSVTEGERSTGLLLLSSLANAWRALCKNRHDMTLSKKKISDISKEIPRI